MSSVTHQFDLFWRRRVCSPAFGACAARQAVAHLVCTICAKDGAVSTAVGAGISEEVEAFQLPEILILAIRVDGLGVFFRFMKSAASDLPWTCSNSPL